MKLSFARLTLLCVAALTLISPASAQRRRAQRNLLPAMEAVTAIPYYPSEGSCGPVQVWSINFYGKQPPEVVVPGITLKSLSSKPVVAVRVGWNVFDNDTARIRRILTRCDALLNSHKPLLSGTIPVIKLEPFYKDQTYLLSPVLLRDTFDPPDKSRQLEHPLVTVSDIKSLVASGTSNKFKDRYNIVVFVAEVYYQDGTKWELIKSKPSMVARSLR